MDLETLRMSGQIIFEAVAGSQSYGTATPTSDTDIRGIFIMPYTDRISLFKKVEEVNGAKQDDKYYELAKFVKLASECNPNIIELLWSPPDCIRIFRGPMQVLWDNRSRFISARAYHTFSGYAHAQIKKARGQNKRVYNPQPERMPSREDFCWIIADGWKDSGRPARPVALMNSQVDISRCHAAALEHTAHVYRLYDYGAESRGVFRGDDNLVCESIPQQDEQKRFVGLMIYNKDAFESALREWRQYWDWKNNRNDQRWLDQENGELDYDAKNLMHCMRLLLSGINILRTGEPIVRFEGEQLQLLREIRAGKFPYEEIMAWAERLLAEMEELTETTSIPRKPDIRLIDKLYLGMLEEAN